MKKVLILGCLAFTSLLLAFVIPGVIGKERETFFQRSLHFTGEGMRYWYEKQGGFMDVTHIPYDKLDCKNCHVRTCDTCHAERVNGKMFFSLKKAKATETCLPCHGREALAMKFDKEANSPDVHFAAGMGCTDCHKGEDVHGDGISYRSMRDHGAMKVSCLDCHKEGVEGPRYEEDIKAHTVHNGRLDCNACHVKTTMACYNCHFSTFLKTGKKKGNFIPMKDWLLLINYEGHVTSASAMLLVNNKDTFVAYAPYRTHSIMAKGRDCTECHNNQAVNLIKEGKRVPVVKFEDGKAVPWQGVVPVVHEKLNWVFLDKRNNKWIPMEKPEPKVQFAAYGTPITEEQLKSLMVPQK